MKRRPLPRALLPHRLSISVLLPRRHRSRPRRSRETPTDYVSASISVLFLPLTWGLMDIDGMDGSTP